MASKPARSGRQNKLMQCISCSTDIDPKWSHAINQNICPFCGGSILEEKLKGLLSTLADTLKQLQEFPEQLNDWLLSNYSYIKTDSPDLPLYLPAETIKSLNKHINDIECQEKKTKVVQLKIDGKMQDVVVEKLASDERTQAIFDRTEIIKGMGKTSGKAPRDPNAPELPKSIAERTQFLKEVNERIKREAKQGFVGEDQLASMIAAEGITDDGTPPPEVADLQAAIMGEGSIASALPMPNNDDNELPGLNVVAALVQRAGSRTKQSSLEKDTESLRKMHEKVANGQNAVLSHKGAFGR